MRRGRGSAGRCSYCACARPKPGAGRRSLRGCQGDGNTTWRAEGPQGPGTCRRAQDEHIEQVNNLSEIQALRRLSPHPNILMLHEVVFDKKAGCLSLICELMDMNIYELIKGRRKPLPEKKIKTFMYQLCTSLDHMHRNGIFHRDVKPENILIKQNTLKLADFGSCRTIYSKQPYTEYISTRWYRAPECLLTNGYYSYKMDIWSAGCVFYEITSFQPLFPGSNDLDQISKIHDVIGTPANKTLNKFKQSTILNFHFPFKKGKGIPPPVHNLSSEGLALLYAMIKYDPDERIAAHQALQHPYLQKLWAADTQALATHKKVRLLENRAGQVPLHLWQTPKESQRECSLRKVQEKNRRQHGPPCGKLPILSPSAAANLPPPPTPTPHSVFPAAKESGETSVLQSVRFIGSNIEAEKQKAKSSLKCYRLPAIERRGGGY
ncbi:MAPK/MAK/MRK overlapping kinase isoform X2 [Numida meleagris]|uniref:MAPK/MAK/MRK overlapping kinase isoform X2 n=1 Tax=Numida meleagris TaxID=8996 RepID=UPI000B3D9B47|nr:MAPK/MAK/MRK overlapping kinase isoform X2 [Numida meleagris]XP_021256909.1 MAPK/MAK/MRK overlapping kinase isoform X2 [Numida meleagris]XP_021256910.1 MAPK/MAK/MRK overlapping kinase isoform X2 [Numida meleagris]XP_021256911.1 MAPK/MAK/MRK overlapping kinase isoform X2 [Numida meleagris]